MFDSITGKDTLPIPESSGSLPYIPKTSSTSKIAENPNGTVRIISPLEIGVSQIGISKDNTFQATSSKINVTTVDIPTKMSIGEIGSTQVRPINIDTTKFGSNEASFTEIGITHGTTVKMSTSQVDTAQILPRMVSDRDVGEREISSASNVEIKQFITDQTLIDHSITNQVQNIELALFVYFP